MKRLKGSYTVMILSDLHSKNYSFNVSKRIIKVILGITSCVVILSLFFIISYIYMLNEISELRVVYDETKQQEAKIQKFASTIDTLKRQMVQLKELDLKLRMMADLTIDPEDAKLFGMGGEESVREDEKKIDYMRMQDSLLPDNSLRGKEENIKDGSVDLDLFPQLERVGLYRYKLENMGEDLMVLQNEAKEQEISLREVTDNMKDRQYMWASTPSLLPVKGWISSGFGKRISPFTGKLTMHRGIDIVARKNTPIIAPADGRVTYIGFDSGLGKWLKINHGYGKITIYGHLSSIKVKRGERIKRGDLIGYVGNTGLTTGPHLHYEILVNGVRVNPKRYIINM